MIRVHRFLLKFKPYAYLIDWSKVCVLPGFKPLPLYTVASFFFQEIRKEALIQKASSLSFNFMMAIFPGIIFLFTLIPYIPQRIGFQAQLMSLLALILPNNAYLAFEATINDIVNKQHGSLLSIGFLLSMYFATNGIHTLMMAFNKSSLAAETRSEIKRRLIALGLTMVMILSMIICFTAMTVGEVAINYLKNEINYNGKLSIYLIQFTRWALLAVLYFVNVSFLYKFGPASTKNWKFFSMGSWLASILAFITIWGFSFYIDNFGTYNKIYGSIGTLMVVMIWLHLNSLILLIGFELNASVQLGKKSVKIVRPRYNFFKTKPNA